MDSILVDSSAPDHLHSHFSQVALCTAKDIKSFVQLMDDSKTKEVLKKAKQSRAIDAEGITAWVVSERADWLDVAKDATSDEHDMAGESEEQDSIAADMTVEHMQARLEKFKESQTGIEAKFEDETKTIKVGTI